MGSKIAQLYLLIAIIGLTAPVAADSLHADLRLAGMSLMNQSINPYANLGASLDYNFFADYSVAVDYSYSMPFTEFKEYLSKGLNDVGLSLSDKSLWADKVYDVNVSGRFGVLLPVSVASRTSSMTFGLSGGLAVKKGFGKTSFTYSLSGDYFDHVYQTAVEDDKSTIFNTRFDVINKIAWAFNVLNSLQSQVGVTMASYYDYSSTISNVYSLGFGISYEVNKTSSLDIGFRTSMQNPSDRVIWIGPPTASRLFRPEGSLITLGTTIAI